MVMSKDARATGASMVCETRGSKDENTTASSMRCPGRKADCSGPMAAFRARPNLAAKHAAKMRQSQFSRVMVLYAPGWVASGAPGFSNGVTVKPERQPVAGESKGGQVLCWRA